MSMNNNQDGEVIKNKYFVFSDVHGESEALQTSLKEAGYDKYNPRHILVSLGDNFDRGADSRGVCNILFHRQDTILIKGNHEGFLEEMLEKGIDGEFVLFNLLHNGLDKTLESFSNCSIERVISAADFNAMIDIARDNVKHFCSKGLLQKIKDMPLYFETKNYIFVHAGFEPDMPWQASSEDVMLWDIEYSHRPISSTTKTVVIGHNHAFRVRDKAKEDGYRISPLGLPWVGNTDENAPVRIGNKIAIDPCSNLTHKVNVLVIEDEPLEPEKDEAQKETDNQVLFTEAKIGSFNMPDYYTYTVDNGFTTRTYTVR